MTDDLDRLDDLIVLDIDAASAYEAAIPRIHSQPIRQRLESFQGDHERHVRELSAFVEKMGRRARTRPDLKGFLIRGFTAITSMMGDEAALKALQGNEELTSRTYRRAVGAQWSDELRKLIEANYADEQRHLAYVQEALRDRIWEARPVQP
jgi:uncharacterized protein (TIGR02284 family)